MDNTGRIRKPLVPRARRILFKYTSGGSEEELEQIARVDQAHVLMLAECGIIDPIRARRLIMAIERLRAQNFVPLAQKEPVRGLFLLYEDYLISIEGPDIGGLLQIARSRNDLNATVLKLRLRGPVLKLAQECLRLHAALLRRANQYANVVMPLYTHGQAAMPATYGHYLAGVASALTRDLEGILAATADLQSCPLGAGALAGTSFPIRPARTAELLGFSTGPIHSLDSVASRDFLLRLLSASSIYSITLSRLATDLLLWSTAEFQFVGFPDELVGSSSAMPQKRNPFILEHVQGRAAALLGAFVQSAASMHATPFTNSIAVGTEATKPIWGSLQTVTEMVVLMRLAVAKAAPNTEAMLKRAVEGYTVATEFANLLVTNASLDYRSAHHLIGEAVLNSQENGSRNFQDAVAACLKERGISLSFGNQNIDPASVARSLEAGGGPGPRSLSACLQQLESKWKAHRQQKQSLAWKWRQAEAAFKEQIQAVLAEGSLSSLASR
jgi:argininosuccinate lyase